MTILYPSTSTQNHSVSNLSGNCFKSLYFMHSWAKVVRPYFLLEENPANAKLGSVRFSAEVQWVSCSRITRDPCCTTRWSRIFILIAMKLSMFSCKTMSLRNVLTVCPEKGNFIHMHRPYPKKDVCQLAGLGWTSKWVCILIIINKSIPYPVTI